MLKHLVLKHGRYLNWTNNTGHALIKECEIEIGGKTIEKHTSLWMDIYNELFDHELNIEWLGLNKHGARAPLFNKWKSHLKYLNIKTLYTFTFLVYFKDPGLALPLYQNK